MKYPRAIRYQEVISHPFPGVTIIDYLPPGHARPLQPGDMYRLTGCGIDEEVFEVLSTTAASALVRGATKKHRAAVMLDKKTGEEKLVEFDMPQRGFQVSRFSSVVLLEKEG